MAQDGRLTRVPVYDFINLSPENAIVFSGPGWGKTTFLHYIFRSLVNQREFYVILVTLRRPSAVEHLEEVVNLATEGTLRNKTSKIVLLIDGYDEITLGDRRRVSEALLNFSAARVGRFILTCRDHYQVSGISCSHVFIEGFDIFDKYRFVKAFLRAFRSRLDPVKMVNQLEERDLSDFLSHPLLLALACINKCGQGTEQPRSVLRLLERTLITLQYNWDEHKGVKREALTSLDGGDRIQILKRIAFASKSPFMQSSRAEAIARKAIDRMQLGKVDPCLVLRESAQFYGILVESSEGWEFVHRSIQDFLAARHWVECGQFANEVKYDWSTRTAYAACLSENATTVLLGALRSSSGYTCAAEILMNSPSFDEPTIALEIEKFYQERGRVVIMEFDSNTGMSAEITPNLFSLFSDHFLNHLIERFSKSRKKLTDALLGRCIAELRQRLRRMDFVTFSALSAAFPNLRFQFRFRDGVVVTPEMARPISAPSLGPVLRIR
jgi:hypothetical protein